MPGTSTDISGPATHLRGRRGREGSHFFFALPARIQMAGCGLEDQARTGL